jgi:hypothetical protein
MPPRGSASYLASCGAAYCTPRATLTDNAWPSDPGNGILASRRVIAAVPLALTLNYIHIPASLSV